MKHGFFVTGTDTNVGKTVVSAALIGALRRRQPPVRYWKPIQTGIEADDDTRTVRELADCSDAEIFDAGYRLEKPLSPHLSAKLAGIKIEIDEIASLFDQESSDCVWVVEGAGGVFVPLNERDLIIDLMAVLKLPVVIAARSGLGTINHTLLTVEALRNRQLEIAGVVMNGEPNTENRRAIEHFGRVKILGELPFIHNLNAENLNNWCVNLKL